METIRGTVQRLIFANESNSYCVFLLYDYNEERITCTGKCEAPKEGDELELTGRFVEHPKYGTQFDVRTLEKCKPDTIGGAKQYLMNLGVKGFGEKSAEKVIAYFEDEIIDILKSDDPKELLEVPGLRKSIKEDLYHTLIGEGVLQELNRFLEAGGISAKWSRDIYNIYGGAAIDVLRDNPYTLLHIPGGPSFTMADTLASSLGIEPDDPNRIEAGLRDCLTGIGDNGHSCLPVDVLIQKTFDLLHGCADEIAAAVEEQLEYGQLAATEHDGILYVYTPELYMAETESVALTQLLMNEPVLTALDTEDFLDGFEERYSIRLGDEQREAIDMALANKVTVITGGPGTGKTTIVKAIVEAFQQTNLQRILLCAPTGRAAKRLTEATGFEATTIHRMLMPVEGSDAYDFSKNEDDPLEADVVIVDEASMLNIQLYYALVAAVPATAHLVIVGDVDQLPPIGAGFVLRDMLNAETIPYTRLAHIYRQEKGNAIVENAHRINEGQMPVLSGDSDFTFIEVHTLRDMMSAIINAYDSLRDDVEDELDIQILSPMRRNAHGSLKISQAVQQAVNPPSPKKAEVVINGITYRVGDKVIQVLNNYEYEIFNGEIGSIYAISKTHIGIRFTDKDVSLPLDEAESIMPAYAITVHKSQGSEYSVVIIPFIPPYGIMLQRSLLYTAVTRARRRVVLIGTKSAVQRAVDTVRGDERYTLFKERLQGMIE